MDPPGSVRHRLLRFPSSFLCLFEVLARFCSPHTACHSLVLLWGWNAFGWSKWWHAQKISNFFSAFAQAQCFYLLVWQQERGRRFGEDVKLFLCAFLLNLQASCSSVAVFHSTLSDDPSSPSHTSKRVGTHTQTHTCKHNQAHTWW